MCIRDRLKEVAARYGVDASAMRKKADVIAAIEAAKAEQPDDCLLYTSRCV